MNPYPTTSAPTDTALVSQARRGDHHAYRTLVARHQGAVRLAVTLMGAPQELVRTTFVVAHGCLLRESGSSAAVRPFVLQLAHHLHHSPAPVDELVRADSCTCLPFRETGLPWHPGVITEVAGLPASWQAALWHRLVECDDDATIAAVIGVPPAKVPWLVDGALDLLRRNLIVAHRKGSPPQCLGYGLRLERGGGAGGSAGRVGVPRAVLRHAGGCPRCARLLDDLAAIDTDLPLVLAESLLGAAGRRYLAVRAPAVAT